MVFDPFDKEVEDPGLLLREELGPDRDEGCQRLPQVGFVDDAAFEGGEFAPCLGSSGGALLEMVVQFTDTYRGDYCQLVRRRTPSRRAPPDLKSGLPEIRSDPSTEEIHRHVGEPGEEGAEVIRQRTVDRGAGPGDGMAELEDGRVKE